MRGGVCAEDEVVCTGLVDDILVVALGGKLVVTVLAVGRSLVVVGLGLEFDAGLGEEPDLVVVGLHLPSVLGLPVGLVVALESEEVADDGERLDDKGLVTLLDIVGEREWFGVVLSLDLYGHGRYDKGVLSGLFDGLGECNHDHSGLSAVVDQSLGVLALGALLHEVWILHVLAVEHLYVVVGREVKRELLQALLLLSGIG